MKKNIIFIISISLLCLIANLLLIIFCMPDQIPLLLNLNEQITSLCSKWLFLISTTTVFCFSILSIVIKSKYIKIILKALLFISVFENILISIYYSLEKQFLIGSLFKIPTSLLIFMPIAYLIIAWSNILKNLPFKSSLGLKSKYSLETEFLWKQVHMSAKNKFFIAGLLLMLISLIFSLFKMILIELLIFVIIIYITYLLIQREAKSIWNKYMEMNNRRQKIKNKG